MSKGNFKEEVRKEGVQEKVLFINRCAKVVKGGRRFSFSALVVVGDEKGRVGMGFGKANEVADSIKKAVGDANKNVIFVEMEKTTIPHDVYASFGGVIVLIKAAAAGTGVIAGSYVRFVLEMAGIKDVTAKILKGNNPCNQVRATFKALLQLQNRKDVLRKRRGEGA